MARTYEDSPIVKTVKRLLDAQMKLYEQSSKDLKLYTSGATEQLMFQQGAAMTVQAGILEWLDKNFGKPGFTPSDQIGAIVEANIAKTKAERAAREKAEAELRAKQDLETHETVMMESACPKCAAPASYNCDNTDKGANHCPERYAAWEAALPPADIVPAPPANAASPDAAGST